MSLIIPYKYDIGQVIAQFKKDQPVLWRALDNLNTAAVDLNQFVGNIKALSLYERITFDITVADVDQHRYVVRMPIDENNNEITEHLQLTQLVISSKVIPIADDVVDILVSNDRGLTWASILKLTGTDPDVAYDSATLVTGQTLMTYGVKQFARNKFNTNDFLRIDWISGTITDEIKVSLIGNYTLGN